MERAESTIAADIWRPRKLVYRKFTFEVLHSKQPIWVTFGADRGAIKMRLFDRSMRMALNELELRCMIGFVGRKSSNVEINYSPILAVYCCDFRGRNVSGGFQTDLFVRATCFQ